MYGNIIWTQKDTQIQGLGDPRRHLDILTDVFDVPRPTLIPGSSSQ